MRVSLPMYNLPEMRGVNLLFWSAVRAELARAGIEAPEAPDFARRPVPERIEADTLFSQVCGWPLQTVYAGQAVPLGVPVYDAPFCEGPHHAGVFVVRDGSRFAGLPDLRGCRFVFNSVHSNSGMNLPRRAVAAIAGGRAFFGSVEETLSQPGNLERVARGEADATCVDAVTLAFFRRHRPWFGDRLRVAAVTARSPSLPFVTAAATAPVVVAALRGALERAARAPEWAGARAGLLLRDVVEPAAVDYGVQPAYAREAAGLGYPALV